MENNSIQLDEKIDQQQGIEGQSSIITNKDADIVIISDAAEKQGKEMKSSLPHTSLGQYRSDIDGLRTIAIMGVVFSHTWPSVFQGGGMGVDVFFVVSGYLISKIIFTELRKSQSFSYYNFYNRRIRRIFPALITVLIFDFTIECIFYTPPELKQASKTLIAGTLMGVNFQFMYKIRNHLSGANPAMLLWTLGVEEQFYLLWPFLSIILWKLQMWKGLTIIGIAAFLLLYVYTGFTLKVFSQWDLSSAMSALAYWQILVGCFVAYYQQKKIQKKQQQQKQLLPENVNQQIALVQHLRQQTLWQKTKSINGIISSVATILIFFSIAMQGNTKQTLLACWHILIVLSAATYIYFKTGIFNEFLLGNRITRFIGKVSYSWYLFHMPILQIQFRNHLFSQNRFFQTLVGFTLAIIVTFGIQNNIRWRKSKYVVPGLAISMGFLLILFITVYFFPEFWTS